MKIGSSVLQWGLGIDEATRATWDGRVWNITLREAVHEISKLGYPGFDCTEGDLVPFRTRVGEVRKMTADNNIQFVSVWNTLLPKKLAPSEKVRINPRLPMNDPRQFTKICVKEVAPEAVRKDLREKLRFLDMVDKMGGEVLTYGGPFIAREDVRDQSYRLIGEMLNELGEELKKRGMRLAYHVHLSTLLQDSTDVEKLYAYADKRLVGLCLDTAHLTAAGEDISRFIGDYSDRIAHVHLKDERGGRFVELGTGTIDIAGTIKTLRSIGYRHWGMVELDVPNGLPLDSAKVSKKYLDAIARR
ncbi:MAG: sugar phosphate isomerase/epimerase [Thaumarchaeota archaeon]|nr:sugar phosphate isomerase/epimerase [Nitrososphaerota archaeon]